MRRRRQRRAGLAAVVLWALAAPGLAFEVPRLTGPVVDRAGLLTSATEGQIASALQSLRQQGGAQIAVLTVPDLGGLTIEQASIQVVDEWKLGDETRDDGVLLMVANAERRMRIEVGQGLEGNLPDAYARRIIDEAMTPLFQAGNADQGILVGVYQIAQRAHPDVDMAPLFGGGERENWRSAQRRSRGIPAFVPILFLILLLVVGRMTRGGGLLTGMLLGGMIGSSMGHRGGGGFRGGGFRGGGGGFSGGGASGGW